MGLTEAEIETTPQLFILVVTPERSFTVRLHEEEELVLGRSKDAHLRIEDEKVAPRHLVLRVQRGAVEVSVVPGSGGAQLNEIQFSVASRMRVGDQLNVGRSLLILQSASVPAEAGNFDGVMDRSAFTERFKEEMHWAQRLRRPLVFGVIRSRETQGPQEELLARMLDVLGPGSLVGRLGAESLQLCFSSPPEMSVTALAERLSKLGPSERLQVGCARSPEDGTDADSLVEKALQRLVPVDAASEAFEDASSEDEPLFVDPVMVRLQTVLEAWAESSAPVLLQGERGVGKARLGQMLHRRSARAAAPFLKVNASALDKRELQHLFWDGPRPELFERVGRGTLLITHCEALAEATQQELAERVVQQISAPGGADKPPRPAPRVLFTWEGGPAETEHPLARVVGHKLWIPALRDRKEEVLPLAEHFLSQSRTRHGRPRLVLGEEAKKLLLEASWPGNVRQLRNAVEVGVVISESDEIRPDDLPPDVGQTPEVGNRREAASDFRSSLRAVEKDVLLKALAKTRWNVSETAKQLGLPRRTVVYRMSKLGLRRPVR